MVRLILFLLLIGLVLYTVARVMSALRGGDNNLPGSDNDPNDNPDEQDDSDDRDDR